ncbi:MAG TPA: phosphoribosyl-ATP diphosphatase [Acidobacteria bacterium]|nr:phosphoribosyl-ATP diphosphatase [Acidobacteriota bacterium]
MLIASIDIQNARAVQLVGGREKVLDAGDPLAVAERLAVVGELAVIDLDAAMGRGENRSIIERLVRRHPCRVGGGIRDVDAARRWLDAGARRVILGTAARPEVLGRLPRERVMAALDARDGQVMVEGWQRADGGRLFERLESLREHCGAFLVTAIEREGRQVGVDLDFARAVVRAAGSTPVTLAGGVRSASEIAALDAMGLDAQVGMAIYSGTLDLADAFAAPLRSERADGLWPTVVVDPHGRALGLAWSSAETLREAVRTRRGVYHSRSRGRWRKGATSGAVQELLRVDLDCDRDALRFTVRQQGAGFCHQRCWTCWGEDGGAARLARRLTAMASQAAGERPGSYTARLLGDPSLLAAKLVEEAGELAAEADGGESTAAEAECADLLYFALVALSRAGGSWQAVEAELDRREGKLTRRPGDAKPAGR